MDLLSKDLLQTGITKGYISIGSDKITYVAPGKKYNFNNPEEKIRAPFYVELIEKYRYQEKRIDTEVEVPRRTPSDKADILIYEDDLQKKPYIVVECKKDGISQSEINQAVEQAFGNANSLRAKYAIVVAGNVRIAFDVAGFNPRERDKNILSDIPIRYGKITKYKYKKSDETWDLQPADLKALQDKFQQCHDILWEGGKRNPAEAFDEMSKLMFCKIQDERFITPVNEYYQFQIGTYETSEEIAERIKTIYKKAREKEENVFESPIKASNEIIYSIVEKLQGISLSRTDLDAKGKAFEKFLDRVFKGSMGQYFTPRTIVEFMVRLLEPSRYDKVIDPACGSGGFLLYVMDYVRKEVESLYSEQDARDIWRDFALKKIFGIEINSQISRVAMMNMIIHEDGHTNIENNDALEDYDKFDKRKAIEPNKYILLLTNPPFGATVKEQEHKYLKNYVLGGKSKKIKQNSEILFIERCLDLLNENGRMGIVLPDGILMGKSLKYVRDFIMERAEILAVVSLPQLAFMPSGAGVKSSLLFLRKKKTNEKLTKNYPIFMAMVNHIGYEATGKWDTNELPSMLSAYKDFKERKNIKSDTTYTISFEQVLEANRFDPYYFQPKFEKLESAIKSYKNVKRLKEVVEFLEYGLMPTQDYARSSKDGVPMIRVTNITVDGRIDMNDVKYIPFDTPKLDEKRVKEGDVLMVQCGNTTGKIALVPQELKDYTYGSFSFAIRPKRNILLPEYLELVLRSEIGQMQIWRAINIATVRPNTSKPDVQNLLIPIPSLVEQKNIIEKVNKDRTKIEKMSKEIEKLSESIDKIVPSTLKIDVNKS